MSAQPWPREGQAERKAMRIKPLGCQGPESPGGENGNEKKASRLPGPREGPGEENSNEKKASRLPGPRQGPGGSRGPEPMR